jgi:dihydroorotate dehydrogenase (NAD+) catalytic subunit
VFNNVYAGLSGAAIRPIALRMVHSVAKAVKIPVIGLGGITSAEDALAFMMAGASAVQIGTVNFTTPDAGKIIVEELNTLCEQEHIENIRDIVGIL